MPAPSPLVGTEKYYCLLLTRVAAGLYHILWTIPHPEFTHAERNRFQYLNQSIMFCHRSLAPRASWALKYSIKLRFAARHIQGLVQHRRFDNEWHKAKKKLDNIETALALFV